MYAAVYVFLFSDLLVSCVSGFVHSTCAVLFLAVFVLLESWQNNFSSFLIPCAAILFLNCAVKSPLPANLLAPLYCCHSSSSLTFTSWCEEKPPCSACCLFTPIQGIHLRGHSSNKFTAQKGPLPLFSPPRSLILSEPLSLYLPPTPLFFLCVFFSICSFLFFSTASPSPSWLSAIPSVALCGLSVFSPSNWCSNALP